MSFIWSRCFFGIENEKAKLVTIYVIPLHLTDPILINRVYLLKSYIVDN